MEAYAPPGELSTLAQRPVRILIVNDNAQEQQLLKLKLETLGAHLTQVRHGRLAIMTCQKTLPDIVILDLATTDMPGLEVLRHLKSVRRTSAVPVICLSTSRDENHRLRALRLNADWYLAKPFRFSELLARLRYHAQEIASRTSLKADMSQESLRKNIMRASVDTLSDIQDVRKALHGLKGYVGADDYYLNNKLETCFRNLMRIETRLKDFREWSTRRSQLQGNVPMQAAAQARRIASDSHVAAEEAEHANGEHERPGWDIDPEKGTQGRSA